ncbi:MAG: YdeI/OmpD-associated family protein [Chloroflexi bacterium]|nr:YdeI/OmpD-associated family protein [Chloroflexota bacterium]
MARRPVQPMPKAVLDALEARGVRADYEARPFYQRNDYLAWIARGQRAETRERRLAQMLDELERGGVYMKMAHNPSRKD